MECFDLISVSESHDTSSEWFNLSIKEEKELFVNFFSRFHRIV